jgi:hypothetical protein
VEESVGRMPPVGREHFLGLGKAILASGHALRFQAKGWSMHPFLRDGDFLTVAPIGDSPVKAGEIVFYIADEEKALVHRALGRHRHCRGSVVFIKGDACLGFPERVPEINVLGRVTVIERNGRKRQIGSNLHRIAGLLLAVFSPLRWLLYSTGSKLKSRALLKRRPG